MPGSQPGDSAEAHDHWRRTLLLLGTATDAELLDPALSLDDLLFRLFHEDGVRVFRPLQLSFGCSCDEERVHTILKSFTPGEIEEMRLEDGRITVTCQFCSRQYELDRAAVDALSTRRLH